MKTIEPINIWVDGQMKRVQVLNAYAFDVLLDDKATFRYQLFDIKEDNCLTQSITDGIVDMPKDEYSNWENDEYAWNFVASSLNLVITGDYQFPDPVNP